MLLSRRCRISLSPALSLVSNFRPSDADAPRGSPRTLFDTLARTAKHLMNWVRRELGPVLTALPVGPSHPGRAASPTFDIARPSSPAPAPGRGPEDHQGTTRRAAAGVRFLGRQAGLGALAPLARQTAVDAPGHQHSRRRHRLGGHTGPRGCVGPLRRSGQVRWVTVATAGELIRYGQQLHTIACKQMTAPASHGRAAPAILSCGRVEPVQAGGGTRAAPGQSPGFAYTGSPCRDRGSRARTQASVSGRDQPDARSPPGRPAR